MTGNKDNTVCLFSRKDKNYVLNREYKGHTEDVTAVLLTHSCHYIYSASNDKTIKQWEVGG